MTLTDAGHTEAADQSLLLVGIGPVQDFIASARGCQDLWFGSWLLSELTLTAAVAIEDASSPGAVIVPANPHVPQVGGGNRIIARLSTPRVATVTTTAREKVVVRLLELANAAWVRSKLTRITQFDQALADDQLGDLIEFGWVAVPHPPSADYATVLESAECLMAARKTTRVWSQLSPVSPTTLAPKPRVPRAPRPKSRFDGRHESVFEKQLFEDYRGAPERLWRDGKLDVDEHLDGAGYLKRLGHFEELQPAGQVRRRWPLFHSTSHLAASGLLVRAWREPEVHRAVSSYLDTLRKTAGVDVASYRVRCETSALPYPSSAWHGALVAPSASVLDTRPAPAFQFVNDAGVDGALFFESRVMEAVARSTSPDQRVKNEKSAVQALRECLRVSQCQPSPYYAVLQADGDDLGRFISETVSKPNGEERHRLIGRALSDYASTARDVIHAGGGSLVYAGGDDLLAMLPLHTVLQVALALREAFRDALRDFAPSERLIPTMSMGIAIVHHLSPLVEARELARAATREAKQRPDKDAWKVALQLRNGGCYASAGSWRDAWGPGLPSAASLAKLSFLATATELQILAAGLTHHLERVLATYQPVAEPHAGGKSAVGILLERAITRRVPRETRAQAEVVTEWIADRILGAEDVGAAARELSAELRLAALLGRAYRVAWGTPTPPLSPAREEIA